MMIIEFIGMLVPTFLVRGIFLWALRKRVAGTDRLLAANVLSGITCGVIAGFGYADGGPFVWRAFIPYGIAQLIWLIFDNVRFAKGKSPDPARSMADPPEKH